MPEIKTTSQRRGISSNQKFTAIGVVAAASVASLALTLTPDSSANTSQARSVSDVSSPALVPSGVEEQKKGIDGQLLNTDSGLGKDKTATHIDAAKSLIKQKDQAAASAEKNQKAEKAATESRAEKSASRSTDRSAPKEAPKAAPKTYSNNLDGWIREAMDIMKANGIPGSYEGIHRNIMRESSGDPKAINNWDINAVNGVPSKGLLQVIKPTFDAYHVEGTKKDQYDPVANIVAACNYAADRYGSMDNVDSAY